MKKYKAVNFYEDFCAKCECFRDNEDMLPFCMHPDCTGFVEDPDDEDEDIGVCEAEDCPLGRQSWGGDYDDLT